MKILAGLEEPDRGEIHLAGDAHVAYLPQAVPDDVQRALLCSGWWWLVERVGGCGVGVGDWSGITRGPRAFPVGTRRHMPLLARRDSGRGRCDGVTRRPSDCSILAGFEGSLVTSSPGCS
jgi:hypothetical protein